MRKVCLLYCLSGLLSLAYQVAWFRIFVDAFGSTNLTFALVLCNFIGGLGVGALLSAPIARGLGRLARLRDPLRVYGLVEVLVAATVLLTPLAGAIPAETWGVFPYVLRDGIYEPTIAYRLASVAVATACVFVPCLFMGVTFPLLCAVGSGERCLPSRLYAWNTMGACAGVLVCEFALIPWLGHDRTLVAMVVVNAGLGCYFLARGRAAAPVAGPPVAAPADLAQPGDRAIPYSLLITCAIVSGLITGSLEGDVFKRLRFLGCAADVAMSFISFWAILGIFLASWTVRRAPRLSFNVIRGLALVAIVTFGVTWNFGHWLRDGFVQPVFGRNLLGLLVLSGLFVLPAMYLVSFLLPFVCDRVHGGRRHLGVAYGLNTVAFCVGMAAFTWLAPAVNIFYALKLSLVTSGLLVGFLFLLRANASVPVWKPVAAVAALVLAVLGTPAGFEPDFFPAGSPPTHRPVRAMKSNAAHTTFIVEHDGHQTLYFSHHPMSGTRAESQRYMRLMAHVPLLAHPDPRSALLICFGVGNTASAIAAHETIERIDVVDLNDKVFATAPEFAATNGNVTADPRLVLIHDDGRSFLDRTDRRYDLVTSEPPPPQNEGVYRLYSREYYASVLEHLSPQGLMTQWLPVYQMSTASVHLAVRTFTDVFPHTLLFSGSGEEFVLVGSGAPIDLATLERRFAEGGGAQRDLQRIGIDRPLQILARIVQTDAALRAAYGHGRVISDRRNDLAHHVVDPEDATPAIAYDPRALMDEPFVASLAERTSLTRTVTDLARLTTVVPDFPPSSLLTVPHDGAIASDHVDWRRLQVLRTAVIEADGDPVAGIVALERCLALVPDHPALLSQMAILRRRAGDLAGSLATWERCRALMPDFAFGQFGTGCALLESGRADEAVTCLRRAVELASASALFHRTLGEALAVSGDTAAALIALDRAIALDPGDPHARRARALTAAQTQAAGG